MASTTEILHQAVVDRDPAIIDKILKNCDSWRSSNNEGETVLHLAFKNRENILDHQQTIIQTLQCFLDEGLSVNIKNSSGRTVLFPAIEDRLRGVIDFLLKSGADINTRDENGNSIVHLLIEDQFKKYVANSTVDENLESLKNFECEDIDFIIWLLSKSVNADHKNNDGKTALHLAIERNLQHVMPILIKYMNDVSHIDENGLTIIELFFQTKRHMITRQAPVHLPVPEYIYNRLYGSRYDIDIVKFLLNKGVSVDHVSKKGNTLMHTFLKSYAGNPEIIRWMLQRYTKINSRDEDDNTALHLVIVNCIGLTGQHRKNTIEFVRTLLSKGADVNAKNKYKSTPVSLAIAVKYLELLKVLLEYGADLSPSKNSGYYPLHELGMKLHSGVDDESYAPIVDMLVRAGWDVNAIRPGDHYTPLLEACRFSSPAIAQKLIDNGANVHHPEPEYLMSPIQMAVGCQPDEDKNVIALFKMLVKAGANVNVKNVHGKTALHMTYRRGYLAYKTLLDLGADLEVKDNLERVPMDKAVEADNFEGMKALLEFGADVNGEGLLMILKQKIEKLSSNKTVDYVVEHWLKLKAANLPVSSGFADYAKKKNLQEFYKECLEEVETLKANYIDDQTTLYHLLHMDVRERCAFIANNDKLKKLIESSSLESNFPKYKILILARYHKAIARHPLIEPARRAWYHLTKIELPDVCVRRILYYLKNEDLKLMAEEDDEIESLTNLQRKND